jgi:ATP-dependent Clp protease protease subunit
VASGAFKAELNSGRGPLNVWINSLGGECLAGAEIYNALKEYSLRRGRVTTKIDAVAASAASVVAMAGDEVHISPVGMLMIHNPWTTAQGESKEMECMKRILDETKESLMNAYIAKSGMSRAELSKMMDDETWMSAIKAKELGFVDKIMYTGDSQALQNAVAGGMPLFAYTPYWARFRPVDPSVGGHPASALHERLEKLKKERI